jgi:TetR/AcrR family transcriptional regulator
MSPRSAISDASGDAVSRILQAATELFARHGFDHVSMNAVAEAAGVSKANIFHHFKSKDELYVRSLSQACEASRSSLDAMAEGEGDAWQRIRRFVDDHLQHMMEYSRDSRLILREVVENRPGTAQRLAQEVFRDNFNRLVGIIADCQREGALRAELDPVFVATLLLGANVFFFQSQEVMRHLDGVDFADDPSRYGAMFVDILMHGAMPGSNLNESDPS